jgi:hypothetical protein
MSEKIKEKTPENRNSTIFCQKYFVQWWRKRRKMAGGGNRLDEKDENDR